VPSDNPLRPVEITAIQTEGAAYTPRPLPGLGDGLEVLPLVSDPDTGMQVMKAVYRAGFVNRWHTHPCAHGIYVLTGTLVTHQGAHPAGSFVWFPEGGTMEHGASPDGDVTMLFITNKPFAIHHVFDD
jgi:quercetin dioxygenase-like cupin family protein